MSYAITIDKADTLFSQWVRLRDRKCMRCSSAVTFNPKGLPISHQASHFQGRRKEATRFDPLNVDTLCGGCHSYFTANPAEHYLWQVAQKGQETVDKIIVMSNSYKKKDRTSEVMYWSLELKKILDNSLN